MICVQGIGASLNNSLEALDVVDSLGQSHHESLIEKHKMGTMGKGISVNTYPEYTTMGFSYTTDIDSSERTRIFPEG